MSAVRSPAVEMVYGTRRVCSAWDEPRSTYYEQARRRLGWNECSRQQFQDSNFGFSNFGFLTAECLVAILYLSLK